MSDHKDIIEQVTTDIELQVMMGQVEGVTLMEEIRRELIVLRQFKRDVKDQLAMAMFAYSKNEDGYVKGIVEELIKLEKGS